MNGRWQRTSLILGIAVSVLCVAAGFFEPQQFFRSYLLAFSFWSGIPLGCLGLLMMFHLVGGGWGFLTRRLMEAAVRTIPLLALLVIPILAGMPYLYDWTHHDIGAKQIYLNPPFFVMRTVLYFAVWIALAHFLDKWSREQDRSADPALVIRLKNISGPGLVLFVLTVSFAAVDWMMSLEVEWFSTIYGALFICGQVLTALAFLLAILTQVAELPPLRTLVVPKYLNDLGNLMFAFLILWAYMQFSQFLIIWAGNLTDEIPWYLHRMRGAWGWIASAVIVFHFAVPFALLLSRHIKRRLPLLARVAIGLLVVRLVGMFWMVEPAFDRGMLRFHWLDWVLPIGMGGLWFAAFLWRLSSRPLLPEQDPRLEESYELIREERVGDVH